MSPLDAVPDNQRAFRPRSRFGRVVFDFYGTLTDPHENARSWLLQHNTKLCEYTGIPRAKLQGLRDRARRSVKNNPVAGWEHGGFIVAPYYANPYIFELAIKQETLRLARAAGLVDPEVMAKHGFDPDRPDELLQRLYREAHESSRSSAVAFRPKAGKWLRDTVELLGARNVAIVTSGGAEKIEEHLAKLAAPVAGAGISQAERNSITVLEHARKHVITPGKPDTIEPTTRIFGVGRAIQLHRNHYAEALRRFDENPSDVVVVGNVYELDLALPEALGHPVVLLRTQEDAGNEAVHLKKAPRGYVAQDYGQLYQLLVAHLHD